MNEARRVLVTGGLGLVGAPLVRWLSAQGYAVVVFDDESTGRREAVDSIPNVEVVRGDVSRRTDLNRLETGEWESVYHLAAQANVPASVADPVRDFQVNGLGTLHVLEWARKQRIGCLVYASTVAVYAPDSSMPVTEDAPLGPSSPYGASKLAGEALFRAHGRSYGLRTVILRLFNIYGPGMTKYVIHDLVRKLLANPRELVILGDGGQVRDYLHVSDAARAFMLAAAHARSGEIINLGSGVPVRIDELADRIIDAMGLEDVCKSYTGSSWPGDVRAWYADTRRMRELGFEPQIRLKEGLADVVADLRRRQGDAGQ
jgi:UDP-glucose 4-epimerase